MQAPAAPEDDPQLELYNSEFDALLASITPAVEPPVPAAQPLDSLAPSRALLPPEREARLRAALRRHTQGLTLPVALLQRLQESLAGAPPSARTK